MKFIKSNWFVTFKKNIPPSSVLIYGFPADSHAFHRKVESIPTSKPPSACSSRRCACGFALHTNENYRHTIVAGLLCRGCLWPIGHALLCVCVCMRTTRTQNCTCKRNTPAMFACVWHSIVFFVWHEFNIPTFVRGQRAAFVHRPRTCVGSCSVRADANGYDEWMGCKPGMIGQPFRLKWWRSYRVIFAATFN